VRLHLTVPRGSVSAGESDVRVTAGPTFDLRDDLGFTDPELLCTADLALRLGRRERVEVGALGGVWASRVTLPRGGPYNDTTFVVGERARGHVRFVGFSLGYSRVVWQSAASSMWLGAGLGSLSFDSGIEVPDTNGGGKLALEDIKAYVSYVRLSADLRAAGALALHVAGTAGVGGLRVLLREPASARYLAFRTVAVWAAGTRWRAEAGLAAFLVRLDYSGMEGDDDFGDNHVRLVAAGPEVGVRLSLR
jgi:hypothetical protein